MVSLDQVDFRDTEKAYAYKTTAELKQTLLMYRGLNNSILGPVGKRMLKFSVKNNLPVDSLIKATLYKHFVGGETLEESLPLAARLAANNVLSILDYSEEAKETEAELDKAFAELRRNILFGGEQKHVPFAVFKATAIAPNFLLEKVSMKAQLNPEEEARWSKAVHRFHTLCEMAAEQNLPLIVDAEESWIQPAIDELTMEAMQRHNRNRVIILNTYQLYRWDAFDRMKADFETLDSQGAMLGAKIVRGAYYEKENARAEQRGYRSPIHPNKESTDVDYNKAVVFCIENADRIKTVIGTHNEYSSMLTVKEMEKKGMPPHSDAVWFSQLYGMCDHISFNLAAAGYNVAKYVPYGPVKSVIPYLVRRADENSSVAGQAGLEMQLIKKELERRSGK